MDSIDHLKFPIGKFKTPEVYTMEIIRNSLAEIEQLPQRLKKAIDGNESLLKNKYREGGWTGHQVLNHIFDSHVNAYIRTKLALTEDHPTIKPYEENKWAELIDGRDEDVTHSIAMIELLHTKWVKLLRSLNESDLKRTFFHPEQKKTLDINWLCAIYAWHSNHHLGHIELITKK